MTYLPDQLSLPEYDPEVVVYDRGRQLARTCKALAAEGADRLIREVQVSSLSVPAKDALGSTKAYLARYRKELTRLDQYGEESGQYRVLPLLNFGLSKPKHIELPYKKHIDNPILPEGWIFVAEVPLVANAIHSKSSFAPQIPRSQAEGSELVFSKYIQDKEMKTTE